jgi:hypothetical protein
MDPTNKQSLKDGLIAKYGKVTTNDGKEIGYIWVRITTADTWNG